MRAATRRIGLVVGAVALAAAPGAAGASAGNPPAKRAGGPSARLAAFDGCGHLARYARRQALRLTGPYGVAGLAGTSPRAVPAPVEEDAATADGAERAAGTDFSTTNVQEAGVDEPDLVKTDGSTVFTVAGGELRAIDVTGDQPRVVSSLPFAANTYDQQLLLVGDRLVVLARSGGFPGPLPVEGDAAATVEIAPGIQAGTVLTRVDVRDPSAMRQLDVLELEGNLVSARLTGSTVRVVVSSQPHDIAFAYPQEDTREARAAATKDNRAAVRRTRAVNWAPRYVHDRRAGPDSRGLLVRCAAVRHPRVFSGFGMLSVVTIDPAETLAPVDTDAVMGDGELVYASPLNLYVATQRWADPESAAASGDPPGLSTLIHKFDAATPSATSYRASGRVPGYLLNQFAMSEDADALRVASTDLPSWWAWQEGQQSESHVTVLAEQGGQLVKTGQVSGLGKGERIYAVRFLGKVGYVVTFRQVDPLYTLDLADPANPRVVGELKIRGYSAYLHPIGEGLLLGVGQDATDEGRVQGTQISVFDVHDLAQPVRLQQRRLGEGTSSEAEYDHHAFLYWPPTGLAVLPFTSYRFDEVTGESSYTTGAFGTIVGAGGITDAGTIQHPERAQIRRALVVGDRLYTVSDLGIRANDLATLAYEAWTPFGGAG
jgi:uncharacterized secreted protein with C-terminal beta-propeller domain